MNKEELQALAKVAAKNLKTEQDLNEFSEMLTKITVEAALNAELDDHLGYAKHKKAHTDNNRNGFTSKILQTVQIYSSVRFGSLSNFSNFGRR